MNTVDIKCVMDTSVEFNHLCQATGNLEYALEYLSVEAIELAVSRYITAYYNYNGIVLNLNKKRQS